MMEDKDGPISIRVIRWPDVNWKPRGSLDENTFGKTPAARYLVRALNDRGDDALNRMVGKRITATSALVRDLINAYSEGALSAKTIANTLRLMREEIISDNNWTISDDKLIDQLRTNVQLGHIKQGVRLCTVARKAERVMQSPLKRASRVAKGTNQVAFGFKESSTGAEYCAGHMYEDIDGNYRFKTQIYNLSDIADVTPEILEARSLKRCTRLGKPHTRS